jgi:hypothetical protein
MTPIKKGCRTTLVHAIFAELFWPARCSSGSGPSPSRWPRPVRPMTVSFLFLFSSVSLATFLSRAVSDQCCSARSPVAPSAGRRWPLGGPALLIAMVPSVPDDAVD